MGWTDERVTVLKKLWLEGLSASQIAKRLGGFPGSPDGGRNAVIGKVRRLGLAGRGAPSAPTHRVYKAPQPVSSKPRMAPRTHASVPLPEHVHRIEEPGSATIVTLESHMCKWPIGDPASDGFTFCGRRSADTGPYCREHAQVAYQVSKRRKRTARHERYDTQHINF